jgi:hypothetical protein
MHLWMHSWMHLWMHLCIYGCMQASPEALRLRPLFGSSTCVESRRPRPYEDRCSLLP